MMSHSSLPLPPAFFESGQAAPEPPIGERLATLAHAQAKNLASRMRDAIALRLRGDVWCALTAAHLARGYLVAPHHTDVTAHVGNALWEATIPSRSTFLCSSAQWVAKKCPMFPETVAQGAALLAQYAPVAELLVTDPYVEMTMIGALMVAPILCEHCCLPSRYHTAVSLGIVSVLHATLSARTAQMAPPLQPTRT